MNLLVKMHELIKSCNESLLEEQYSCPPHFSSSFSSNLDTGVQSNSLL